MRFILLAISLFFASNTYAAIVNNFYIYSDDSDKSKIDKEEYKKHYDDESERKLTEFKNNIKNNRTTNYNRFAKGEVVYKVGDISKTDVGVKIGMTKDQVVNKSYWGKPDRVYTTIDGNNKYELWIYEVHGYRNGIYKIDASLYFINGKLAYKVPLSP